MPRSGKIPHAAERLGPEPWLLSLRVRSLCSATGEATTVRPAYRKQKGKPCKWSFAEWRWAQEVALLGWLAHV